ncbi:MAG: hypothetical protein ACEQSX_08205 [Baekduiaceae bacterium]
MQLILQGDKDLIQRLEMAGRHAPADLAAAMYREANYIMRLSVEAVPVDFGVLRGSATVTKPTVRGTVVDLSFGYGGAASAYALAVHENPRSGQTGGVSPSGAPYRHWAKVGAWKFLERPCNEQFPQSAQRMAATLGSIFDKRAAQGATP